MAKTVYQTGYCKYEIEFTHQIKEKEQYDEYIKSIKEALKDNLVDTIVGKYKDIGNIEVNPDSVYWKLENNILSVEFEWENECEIDNDYGDDFVICYDEKEFKQYCFMDVSIKQILGDDIPYEISKEEVTMKDAHQLLSEYYNEISYKEELEKMDR